jgi:hypothetical protein
MVYSTRSNRQSYPPSQILHFKVPRLPSPTPPSLHKRASSTDTASRIQYSPIPSYTETAQRRTSSSGSCSCAALPSMPITPVLEPRLGSAYPVTPISTTFHLPSPASSNLSLPEPTYNWQHKDLSKTSSHEHFHSSYASSIPYTPTRPALKRRDTPRPIHHSDQSLMQSAKRLKKWTSVITGKEWVVWLDEDCQDRDERF